MSTIAQISGEYFLLKETLPFESLNLKKPITPEEQLDAVETILYQTQRAILAFVSKKFAQFDPLVGDQLCEIRAYQIALLSKLDLAQEVTWAQASISATLQCIAQIRLQLFSIEQEENQDIQLKRKELEPFSQTNQELSRQFMLEKQAIAEKCLKEAKDSKEAKNTSKILLKELSEKFKGEFEAVKMKMDSINQGIAQIQQVYLQQRYGAVSHAKIDVSLSQKVMFIVQAYLLTKIKLEELNTNEQGKVFISDKTLVSRLQIDQIKCPTAIFQAAIPLLKMAVVSSSIAFIQQEAVKLKTDGKALGKMIANPRWVASKNQCEMPFYFALKILYQRAFTEQIPILLKIRDQSISPPTGEAFACRLLFKVDSSLSPPDYYPVEPQEDESSIALIVEAFSQQKQAVLITSDYRQNLLTQSGGLLNYLVEIDATQHCQYTDQEKSNEQIFDQIPQLSDEERHNLINQRQAALDKGFGDLNPTSCCVEHVFADLISNQLGGQK